MMIQGRQCAQLRRWGLRYQELLRAQIGRLFIYDSADANVIDSLPSRGILLIFITASPTFNGNADSKTGVQ